MSERIGIVTGGGDCPGLNAVIRAVAKAAARRGWETIGFRGGYEGILEPQQYVALEYADLGALLTRGGTILGAANRGLFSAKVGHGESRRLPAELVEGVQAGMRKLGIRGLVAIGVFYFLTYAFQSLFHLSMTRDEAAQSFEKLSEYLLRRKTYSPEIAMREVILYRPPNPNAYISFLSRAY